MNELWPRLSAPLARVAFDEIGTRTVQDLAALSRSEHDQETYAATGGTRVRRETILQLGNDIRVTAAEFGYPHASADADRIAFDRAGAEVVYSRMEITTVEAANRGIWTFLSVVAMPDVTMWRFNRNNLERWVASDLTRHMFSRLWWQALTFAVPTPDDRIDLSLLRRLSESDLNQITERRAIGGNARLARALARAVVATGAGRREVIRDVTPRLRRRLAFIDFSALNDEQIDDQIRALL